LQCGYHSEPYGCPTCAGCCSNTYDRINAFLVIAMQKKVEDIGNIYLVRSKFCHNYDARFILRERLNPINLKQF
jgi:hypothetical protein